MVDILKPVLARARTLITEKRYAEALAILETVDHPTAAKWSEELRRRLGNSASVEPKPRARPLLKILFVTIPIAIVVLLIYVGVQQQRPDVSVSVDPQTANIAAYIVAVLAFFLLLFGIAKYVQAANEARERAAQEYARKEQERRDEIETLRPEWGIFCDAIIERRVAIGMTDVMVMMSWGAPADIDQREVTSRSNKERWVYGKRRVNASYVTFRNGIVTAIKQTGIE